MADENNTVLIQMFGPPDNVDVIEREEGQEVATDINTSTPDQIDMGALFGPPDALDPVVPELTAFDPEDRKDSQLVITESEVFDRRTAQIMDNFLLDLYGEEKYQQLLDTRKKTDFFMSRAPRIGLAVGFPLYALAFEVADQGINLLVSELKNEDYSPLERRMLIELLPRETPTPLRVAAGIGEVFIQIALIGGAMNLATRGALTGVIKTMGRRLEKAGFGKDKVTITQEDIAEAAKRTDLWTAAKAWIKVKTAKITIPTSRQVKAPPQKVGGVKSTIITPVNGKSVEVITPAPPPVKVTEGVTKGVEVVKGLDVVAKEFRTPEEFIRAVRSGEVTDKLNIKSEKLKLEEILGDTRKQQITELGAEQLGRPSVKFFKEKGIPKGDILVVRQKDKDGNTRQFILDGSNRASVAFERGDKTISGKVIDVGESDLDTELINIFNVTPFSGVPIKPEPPVGTSLPPSPPVLKKPSIFRLITSQSRHAELIGAKALVGPLEIGKMRQDQERAIINNQIDSTINGLKKLNTVTTGEMAVLLNTNVTAPKDLGEEETKVFNYFRALTQDMLKRVNESREATGRDPIRDIGAYFRHVRGVTARGIVEGKIPLPASLRKWAAENVSQKVFNPMELERKLEDELLKLFSKDLGGVMKSMIRTSLKEIHMDAPLKFFNEQMAGLEKDPKLLAKLSPAEKAELLAQPEVPTETVEWLKDYVNIVLSGQQTKLDSEVNLWVVENMGGFLEKGLSKFGFHLSKTPATDFITEISKLPLYGVMGPFNPRQLIRNKFQTVQNLALYGHKATLQGFLPTSDFPTLVELKTDSLFLQTYSGIEDMPATLQGKLRKANFALFQWTAFTNVSQAMDTAYHWTATKIQDPKFKELGWTDPQRTYTEDPNFFYPSEKARLLKEMEYGAHTTQYAYLGLSMPEAFRYKSLAGLTRLNSWWMNHWAVFHREAATRFFLGHTGYDTNLRLAMGDRMNYVKYLIVGGLILNTMGYTRSFLFGTAPTGLPPVASLMLGLFQWFAHSGDSDFEKRARAEAGRKITSSLWTFIPGYLSVKDANALINGEKAWSEYLFYKKKKAGGTLYLQ